MDETTTVRKTSWVKAEAVVKGGSRERITAAYETHAPYGLRLAYLLTGDEQLAQDVVQDAFVRIFSRLLAKVPPNDFQNYLRRTIVNLCKDHWRRKGNARNTKLFDAVDRVDPPEVETRDELWTALRGLPQRQRSALVLRYFEDLSEQQTAEILGCSVGAVKALTTRGTQAMRKRLEEVR